MLKPTENFKLDTLDKLILTVPKPSGFVAISVWTKPDSAIVAGYGKDFYLLRLITISQKRFDQMLLMHRMGFTGYFEFDNCIILVYGNNGSPYFFTKTGSKKKFTVYNDPKMKGADLGFEVHDLMTGYSVDHGQYKLIYYKKNYRYTQ